MRAAFCAGAFVFVYYYLRRGISHVKTYSKTRILVECALMIAIGTVLSNIKFFTPPNGGSVTLLSMPPFVLVSFRPRREVGPVHRLCQRLPADAAGLLGTSDPDLPVFPGLSPAGLSGGLLWRWALPEFFARPFKNRMVGGPGHLYGRLPGVYVTS